MAVTPTNQGYWLVASDGRIFTFGDAKSFGSESGKPLASPIIGIAVTLTGKGYWLLERDGTVFGFGTATAFGSLPKGQEALGLFPNPLDTGYSIVTTNGGLTHFPR